MKVIEIPCDAVADRASLHSLLADSLSLPEWYGRNLDALHDCLTSIGEECFLVLLHWDTAESALGRYGKAARKVMEQADLENPNIHIVFVP